MEPTPAATVVLARDADEGLEVLMLRRNSRGAFGGMWVFPGGKVDPEDVDPANEDDEVATARRAAVREAAEEAGLAVDAAGLVTFSHWLPPPQAPRRFSTWFFLGRAPSAGSVEIDGSEIHDHSWLRPADALARRDAGQIELAPPTWVTLWRLAAVPDVAAAVADATGREPERFETHIVQADGLPVALWHGDAGYESGEVDRPGPRHRLWMLPDGWRFEDSR
jgi:8-oxo-dGTP pyrophosphatase MutT (NUDIX family)